MIRTEEHRPMKSKEHKFLRIVADFISKKITKMSIKELNVLVQSCSDNGDEHEWWLIKELKSVIGKKAEEEIAYKKTLMSASDDKKTSETL